MTKREACNSIMDFDDLVAVAHQTAVASGFWPNGSRSVPEALALIHSEVSEALEADRAGDPDYWLRHAADCASLRSAPMAGATPSTDRLKMWRVTECSCVAKPEGVAAELIDVIIRCADLLGGLLDGYGAPSPTELLAKKLAYNSNRPARHGKLY